MKLKTFFAVSAASLALAGAARADIIDFDSEGLTGPSLASETFAQNVTVGSSIGSVVFSGGAVLTNESDLPADETSLYYTSYFLSGGVDSITITFPEAIDNFFLNVYNGQSYPESFTVADNAGNSNTVTLDSNTDGGVSLVSFPAAGDMVTISTTDTTGFDFSIDNIGFDQPTPMSGAPEPSIWALMIAGVGMIGAALRWGRRNGAPATV